MTTRRKSTAPPPEVVVCFTFSHGPENCHHYRISRPFRSERESQLRERRNISPTRQAERDKVTPAGEGERSSALLRLLSTQSTSDFHCTSTTATSLSSIPPDHRFVNALAAFPGLLHPAEALTRTNTAAFAHSLRPLLLFQQLFQKRRHGDCQHVQAARATA